ncbi:MAG: hypothetical protein IMF07_00870, partial [Proteobacteria bacterium]|nr:hypothetical protein [Pseudomonadota bacterium]
MNEDDDQKELAALEQAHIERVKSFEIKMAARECYMDCVKSNSKLSSPSVVQLLDDFEEKTDRNLTKEEVLKASFVKRSTEIPWGKVYDVLSNLDIEKKAIKALIVSISSPFIDDLIKATPAQKNNFISEECIPELNRRIQKLARISGLIKDLQKEKRYKKLNILTETVACLEWEKSFSQEFISAHKEAEKIEAEYTGIGSNKNKSPPKHKVWNEIVSTAINQLNKYCHIYGLCEDDNCDKIHKKTITKTAELLKLLYPSIW